MKKITLLALLSCFFVLTSNAQLTMYESFEDFNLASYTMGTYATTSNTEAVAGTYSLKLEGGGGTHSNAFVADNFTNNTPDYFSCWIYTGGSSSSEHKAYVAIKNTADNSLLFGYYNADSSKYRISNLGAYDLFFDITQNQWFHLELFNIDYTNYTYDLYVDGKLLAKSNPFRDNVSSVDKIKFYNWSTSTAAEAYTYYDEVRMGSSGTKIPCGDLSNASANYDTICEGDDITFTSQSSVGGDNVYIWSENANPNSSQIIEQTPNPSYTHTTNTSGNLTMYAGRSCETNNMLTTTFEGGNGNIGMLVNLLAKSDIVVDSISFVFRASSTNTDVQVLIIDSSYQGHETDINDWTLLCTKTLSTVVIGDIVTIDISSTPLILSAGESIGFALYTTSSLNSFAYTNLNAGDIHKYNDANLSIYGGSGCNFSGGINENRMANISLHYKAGSDVGVNQYADFGTTTSTYTNSSWIRGMSFVAPIDFTLTGLQAPDDMSVSGNQTVKLIKMKFGQGSLRGLGAELDSTDFIVLGYWENNASSSFIDCNIPIAAGDVIGVFSGRANSFAYSSLSGTSFNIGGEATPIIRLGSNSTSLNSNTEYYNIWMESGYNFARTRMRYEIGTTTMYSNFTAIDYVVEDCTGIEEMENVFAVNLYPNPNNGQFNLDIEMTASSDVQIQVFDAQGRYVTSIQDNLNFGSNVLNLDFSHLNAGIYHINIINNEQSAQVSFMITK